MLSKQMQFKKRNYKYASIVLELKKTVAHVVGEEQVGLERSYLT